MEAGEIFQIIKKDYRRILGDQLTGIYIHGSYAFGCFNSAKSDLDFIVVVHDRLTADAKLRLLECLERLHSAVPVKGFEMSVVQEKLCRHFQYPTPYELHFSNMWRELYLKDPAKLCTDDMKTDKDLAGHFTVIRHCGIVLYGPPIETVFGEVKPAYYIESIVNDIKGAGHDILENTTYTVLNLCRVLAYLKEGRILSKEQGGQWALQVLDSRWRDVVRAALTDYRSAADFKIALTDRENEQFSGYMLDQIHLFLQRM